MNTRQLKKQLKYKIPQIKLVLVKEPDREPGAPIHSPGELEKYLEPMKHLSEENFIALHLDVLMRLIGYHVVSKGTLSESLVHPREVFKAAILSNAHSVVVAHNHPSGSLSPSPIDLLATKQLCAAAQILGINLLDHLIVSSAGVKSIRESHEYLFQTTELSAFI